MSKRATTDQNTEERNQNTNAMAQENFKKENPFQSLDLSRFPKKKPGTRQESRTSKKHFKLADNVARDEDSFAELMRLSGVETLPPKGIVSEPSRSANGPARGSSSIHEPHPQEQANGAKDKKTDHETRTILKTAGLEFRGFDDNFRDPPFSTMGEARGFADLEKTRKQGSAKKTAPLESKAGTPHEVRENAGSHPSFSKHPLPKTSAPALTRKEIEYPGNAGSGPRPDETMLNPEQDDDLALFAQTVGNVSPLNSKGRDVPVAPSKKPAPGEASDIQALQDLVDGKVEFAMEMTEEYIEGHVIGLDQLIIGKMRAGNYHPEAHLDMHGLNANQAYEHLVGFMRGAYYKGFRCVLVIPGRGKNSPDGLGILREKLQLWLTQEPFKRVVLAFCTAQAIHGGPGALYVLLRKYKKNRGKIYWDRLPADPDLY